MGRMPRFGRFFPFMGLVFFAVSALAEEAATHPPIPHYMKNVQGILAVLTLIMFLVALRYVTTFRRFPEGEPEPATPANDGLPDPAGVTRRSFLTTLGMAWVVFTAASLGALSTVLRFFFPNVTFEPPMTFKIGWPGDFGLGVDNRFKDKYAVWVVRDDGGFYALSTVCTHLGCTPSWLEGEQKFKCPCHGSGFYSSGVNFEGPAPRPLERYKVVWADDGQILVDKGQKYQQEKGEWTKSGAYLPYRA